MARMRNTLMTKTVALFLCITMLLSMIPVGMSVSAEGEMVAQIGDAQFATLQEAIDSVKSGTEGNLPEDVTEITLLKDLECGFDVGDEAGVAPKNISIDLNGNTLTLMPPVGSVGTVTNGIRVLANSKLEIKDTSEAGTGKIVCPDDANVKVGIANYSDLVLDNVEIVAGNQTIYTINNRGNLKLKGNTTIADYDGEGTNFQFAITNDPYNLVYTNKDATLTCDSAGVEVGKVQVERYDRTSNNTGSVILNISAGTFGAITEDGAEKIVSEYNITGGTICVSTKEQLNFALSIVEAGTPKQFDDNTVVIKLMADITSGFDVGDEEGNAPQNITLDLNGHTLKTMPPVGSANTETNGIRVLAYSTLQVIDSSESKGGRIVAANQAETDALGTKAIKVVIANYGKLNVADVDVLGGDATYYTINNRGELTLSGGANVKNDNSTADIKYAITNDPYASVYTEQFDATLNCDSENVKVGDILLEQYPRTTVNPDGEIVLNITQGEFGKVTTDGESAISVNFNVTGGSFENDLLEVGGPDLQAPVIEDVTVSTTEWATSVEVTVDASDNNQNAILLYSIDNGMTWQESNVFEVVENNTYKIIVKDESDYNVEYSITISNIDKEAPVITSVVATPALDTYTKDAVVVTLTATDDGCGDLSYKMDGGEWQKSNAFSISDNTEHSFYVKDALGNEVGPYKFAAVNYDDMPPVITDITGNPTAWTKDDVTLTVEAEDAGVKGILYQMNDGEWQTSPDFIVSENGTYTFRVKDSLDNVIETAVEIPVNYIDKAEPVINELKATAEDWTNETVTITGIVSDTQSGVAEIWYKIGDSAYQKLSFADNKIYLPVEVECDTEYTFYCVDVAGNKSDEYSVTIKIDKTKPNISVDAIDVSFKNKNFVIEGSVDDAASGISKVEYSLDGNTWKEATLKDLRYSFDTELSTSGEYTYKIRVTDNAGNSETVDSNTIKYDPTKPTVAVDKVSHTDWTNEDVVIELSANDDYSEVSAVKYIDTDGQEKDAIFVEDTKYKIDLPATNYEGDITVWCIDEAGNESEEINVHVYMDVDKPENLTISYSDPIVPLWQDVLSALTFGAYNPIKDMPLTVTITADDLASGVDYFEWTYTKEDGASAVNAESTNPEQPNLITPNEEDYSSDGKTATVSFEVPAQSRGYISFKAVDSAGNESELNDSDRINIVDTIAPEIGITYQWKDGRTEQPNLVDAGVNDVKDFEDATQAYYSDDAVAIIQITDPNFFEGVETEEGIFHEVGILLTKTDNDGNVTTVEYLPDERATQRFEEANETKIFTWNTEGDVHSFSIEYADEADYVLTVEYTDASLNESDITADDGITATKSYTSKIITVDKTQPEIDIVFDPKEASANEKYFKTDRKATITVTEHNFRADDVDFTTALSDEKFAVDVQGNDIADAENIIKAFDTYLKDRANWIHYDKDGNKTDDLTKAASHTAEITFTADAKYDFKVDYTDLALIEADTYEVDEFVVDHKAPENLDVYYTPETTMLWQDILSALTFGAYNPQENKPLTVTISATDATAGIEYFELDVKPEGSENATDIELPENLVINADGSVKTGNPGFIETITSKDEGGKVSLSFEVPAQFRGEFIIESVTDLAHKSTATPYDDSNVVIVDTIAPEISVNYKPVDEKNTKVQIVKANGTTEEDGNFANGTQAYYNGDVVATITITDPNFFEGRKTETGIFHEVGILLTKTDNDGNVTKVEYLPDENAAQRFAKETSETQVFEWNNDEDTHSFSIAYADDADYVLTVEYTDASLNESDITADDGITATKSYTSKMVTVDKTQPEIGIVFDPEEASANEKYFKTDRKATITVIEHNFRADDVDFTTALPMVNDEVRYAVDVQGNDIADAENIIKAFDTYLKDRVKWTHYDKDGNKTDDLTKAASHTAEITFTADAKYDFKVDYTDLALIEADTYEVDEFVVDHKAPENLDVSYTPETTMLWQDILSALTFGAYNPLEDKPLTVTISATDATAGIEYFELDVKPDGSENATDIELPEDLVINADGSVKTGDSGFIETITSKVEGGKVSLSFKVPPQFRGEFIIKGVTDLAHKSTAAPYDDSNVVIVDTIAPKIEITYQWKDGRTELPNLVDAAVNDVEHFEDATQAYYSDDAVATIQITDPNFFEGVKTEAGIFHKVGILLTKTDNDGNVTKVEYLPAENAAQRFEEATETKIFTWNTEGDVHSFSIEYADEADYVLTVEYTDASLNESDITAADGITAVESYTSKIITVDKTEPEIGIVFDPEKASANEKYFDDDRKATITVTEHNFRADDIKFATALSDGKFAVDVQGNDIADAGNIINTFSEYLADRVNWKHYDKDGNETDDLTKAASHQAEITFTADAKYDFKVDYTDLALIEADTYEVDEFVVDHEKPENLTISYTDSIVPLWQDVLRALTFGVYNPQEDVPLIVTITADDITSGVDYFEWTYTKEEGTSAVNAESTNPAQPNRIVPKAEDYSADGKTATVSFEVPAQARGYISFRAIDRAGIESEWLNDNSRINIVDTIAPKITVNYEAVDQENTKVQFVNAVNDVEHFEDATQAYYNGNVVATITIDEANFFEGWEAEAGIIHEVGILLTKTDNDGKVTMTEYLPAGAEPLFEEVTATEIFTWNTEGDIHTFSIEYADDADYVITVKYADFSTNAADITANDGIKATESYTSKIVTVDKIAPVVNVAYSYSQADVTHNIEGRDYLNANCSATITVTEHNFRATDMEAIVEAVNVIDEAVSVEDFYATLAKESNWKVVPNTNSNVRTITINYVVDANYTFDIRYEDLAKNSMADYTPDSFTVDKTAPTNLNVSYSTNVFENVLESITFGYYNAQMTVTITADDETTGIYHFMYSYMNNEGVSAVNAELLDEAIRNANIEYNGKTATARFTIPKFVLENDNQFNGTVKFTAYDRSENNTEKVDQENIIVDNIEPTAQVTFNDPVQKVKDVSYYDGNINATIVINEANFFSEDVNVSVTKDGRNYPVTVRWTDNSADVHTGTFTLTEDGDYIVNVAYADRSTNEMTPFVSNQLTLDTKEPVVKVTNIKHQSANNDEIIGFTIEVTDTNISLTDFKPTLTAIVNDAANGENGFVSKTITIDLGEATTTTNANGETVYSYTVSNLDTDGYYSLVCDTVDYANHKVSIIGTGDNAGGNTSVETVNFSVNRQGSVFWIETEHTDKSGNRVENDLNGKYVNDTVKITLHEINVDKVDENAEKKTVFTLNDGSSAEDITLVENENYSKNVSVGTGGWYENIYTLDNDNFDNDGVYSINIITYDAAENSNVNTKSDTGVISFTLDRTKPVISANVKNDQRINEAEFPVEFKITETNLDEATIVVKLNGEEVVPESLGNNEYRFVAKDGLNQTLEIVATDLAGNEAELYKVDRFTVSTNVFVLWYANTVLFWSTIAGVIVVIGAIVLFIILKNRKKKEQE